ncbi:hypothetical protein MBANPS3_008952 [Mucor bainieri]
MYIDYPYSIKSQDNFINTQDTPTEAQDAPAEVQDAANKAQGDTTPTRILLKQDIEELKEDIGGLEFQLMVKRQTLELLKQIYSFVSYIHIPNKSICTPH